MCFYFIRSNQCHLGDRLEVIGCTENHVFCRPCLDEISHEDGYIDECPICKDGKSLHVSPNGDDIVLIIPYETPDVTPVYQYICSAPSEESFPHVIHAYEMREKNVCQSLFLKKKRTYPCTKPDKEKKNQKKNCKNNTVFLLFFLCVYTVCCYNNNVLA